MPHGITQPTTLDPILETFNLLQEQFATPETGRRAERFAIGQERQVADLARLFEQSQVQSRQGFGQKLIPFLEAAAFIADATGRDRRRRGEALPKLQAIRGAREERAERKRQQRRQQFADQANILSLIGEGKGAAFETRREAGRTKAQRERDLFGLAIKAQPKPGKEATAADIENKRVRDNFNSAMARLRSFEEQGIPLESIQGIERLEIEAAFKDAKQDSPFPDNIGFVNDLRKQFFSEAATIYKDADPEEKEALIEAYIEEQMIRFFPSDEEINPADFLPAMDIAQPEGPIGPQPRIRGILPPVSPTSPAAQLIEFLRRGPSGLEKLTDPRLGGF